jgi:hypothetical protein
MEYGGSAKQYLSFSASKAESAATSAEAGAEAGAQAVGAQTTGGNMSPQERGRMYFAHSHSQTTHVALEDEGDWISFLPRALASAIYSAI